MVKYTQIICRFLLTNCLSVFDHIVGLAFKVLMRLPTLQALLTNVFTDLAKDLSGNQLTEKRPKFVFWEV